MGPANQCNTIWWSSAPARAAWPQPSAPSNWRRKKAGRYRCWCWKKAPPPPPPASPGPTMAPRALTELIPDWKQRGAPLNQPVTADAYVFLSRQSGFRVPRLLLPPFAQNHGNFIVSLGDVTRWLAEQAEALGVEI